jgi:hypothetical protein
MKNEVIPARSQARIAQATWLRSREAQLRTLAADRIVDAMRVTNRYNAIVPAERLRLLPLKAAGLLDAGS